ncbi:transcriptional regulator [Lentzea sp. PSKA42]|uniref:Transcriptional regulator n=1 Tax=Lentzea indica TaxID=2604800 RepID=A0ABX1FG19_9PSEU|nr:transcriptional regulator [Lentzea indica]NKE57906.1 transcriptional regulator [Lentzea indica]
MNWLDLRGHLRLMAPGLFIDSDVPALAQPSAERQGISGQVGVELSALLLLDPARTVGVRTAAKSLSRAPSSISEAFSALRAAGLVDSENRPSVPGLFWELAEHWKPVSRDVASVPGPGGERDNAALRLGMDDVESTVGWALTDTVAAMAYEAPVSIRAGHPPDFYVPDQSTLRRAVQLLGPATTSSSRAGRVRVAPVSLVCARRIDATGWANEHWPLTNPLFVALDLAQDPGRGREILDGWTPRKPWNRVW